MGWHCATGHWQRVPRPTQRFMYGQQYIGLPPSMPHCSFLRHLAHFARLFFLTQPLSWFEKDFFLMPHCLAVLTTGSTLALYAPGILMFGVFAFKESPALKRQTYKIGGVFGRGFLIFPIPQPISLTPFHTIAVK